MALGGIQALGGLFGGGPRAPRMQECQHQQCMQNPFPNQACAMNMNLGANAINGCTNAFMGQPFGGQFGGPISNFAMAGAGPGGSFAFAGNNGLGNGFRRRVDAKGFADDAAYDGTGSTSRRPAKDATEDRSKRLDDLTEV